MTATQRWTLAVVCAATAMLMLDIAVVNTALSAIAADLDTGLSGLQWVIDAYTLALAATVITAGSLADRFGRRRLFLLGLGVFTATSVLCGLAQSITMLNVSRAAQGVGAAIMFAVSLAVLSHAFPRPQERMQGARRLRGDDGGRVRDRPARRRRADHRRSDWRSIFLINLPLGAACLWIVRRYVAESRDPRAPRVDVAGPRHAHRRAVPARLRAAARQRRVASASIVGRSRRVVLVVAFVAIEARVAQPMLPLRLFRNPSFTGAQVGAVGISASLFALWLYLTLYLQQVLGLSAIEAGPGVRARHAAQLRRRGRDRVARPRCRARVLVAGGLALIAAGLALLTVVGADTSWWLFLPGLLVAMVGTGMLNPAVSQVALELGAAGAERARRRRQRHVPPGRHRGRRRRRSAR